MMFCHFAFHLLKVFRERAFEARDGKLRAALAEAQNRRQHQEKIGSRQTHENQRLQR